MLELPWRYKLIFPLFIVLPLVCVYAGPTQVGVIAPFSWVLGPSLELGCLYLAYITLLGIYFTNAINIYAGINGLEVGQSIIAASGMLAYFAASSHLGAPHPDYTYSVYLLAASLALMRLNAYPASIFIGDTYCYFAGIVLAIAAIWGKPCVTKGPFRLSASGSSSRSSSTSSTPPRSSSASTPAPATASPATTSPTTGSWPSPPT